MWFCEIFWIVSLIFCVHISRVRFTLCSIAKYLICHVSYCKIHHKFGNCYATQIHKCVAVFAKKRRKSSSACKFLLEDSWKHVTNTEILDGNSYEFTIFLFKKRGKTTSKNVTRLEVVQNIVVFFIKVLQNYIFLFYDNLKFHLFFLNSVKI